MDKSIYVAKSRWPHNITLNNFLSDVPNHALKDLHMLNRGTIYNMNSSYYNTIEGLIHLINWVIAIITLKEITPFYEHRKNK